MLDLLVISLALLAFGGALLLTDTHIGLRAPVRLRKRD